MGLVGQLEEIELLRDPPVDVGEERERAPEPGSEGPVDVGLVDRDDGQPIPYNKDDAAKILNDPQYRKIRDGVLWAANVVADQQAAELEEDAKN